MAKRKEKSLGFEFEKAITTLWQEALKAGVVPPGDRRAKDPVQVAWSHIHGGARRGCRTSPCRQAGLCYALRELLLYRTEAVGLKPLLDAAKATEGVRRWLCNEGSRYAQALGAVMKYGADCHAPQAGGGQVGHPHETTCVHASQIFAALTQLNASIDAFDRDLRELAWSHELGQPGTKRRADLLLTAVYQQLHDGGLPFAEIYRLVPDGNRPLRAEERVRKRVESPSARSVSMHERLQSFPAKKRTKTKNKKKT